MTTNRVSSHDPIVGRNNEMNTSVEENKAYLGVYYFNSFRKVADDKHVRVELPVVNTRDFKTVYAEPWV